MEREAKAIDRTKPKLRTLPQGTLLFAGPQEQDSFIGVAQRPLQVVVVPGCRPFFPASQVEVISPQEEPAVKHPWVRLVKGSDRRYHFQRAS